MLVEALKHGYTRRGVRNACGAYEDPDCEKTFRVYARALIQRAKDIASHTEYCSPFPRRTKYCYNKKYNRFKYSENMITAYFWAVKAAKDGNYVA